MEFLFIVLISGSASVIGPHRFCVPQIFFTPHALSVNLSPSPLCFVAFCFLANFSTSPKPIKIWLKTGGWKHTLRNVGANKGITLYMHVSGLTFEPIKCLQVTFVLHSCFNIHKWMCCSNSSIHVSAGYTDQIDVEKHSIFKYTCLWCSNLDAFVRDDGRKSKTMSSHSLHLLHNGALSRLSSTCTENKNRLWLKIVSH